MTLLIKSLENKLAYNIQHSKHKTYYIWYGMAWHVAKKVVNQQSHI